MPCVSCWRTLLWVTRAMLLKCHCAGCGACRACVPVREVLARTAKIWATRLQCHARTISSTTRVFWLCLPAAISGAVTRGAMPQCRDCGFVLSRVRCCAECRCGCCMTAQRCLRLFEADCSLAFATGDRSHKCYTRTLIVHATVVVYHCCSVRAESDCHTVLGVCLVRCRCARRC